MPTEPRTGPVTEAGRVLLSAWRHVPVPWMEQWVADIEAEARTALLDALVKEVEGLDEQRPGGHHFASTELIDRAAVLALLHKRQEAHR